MKLIDRRIELLVGHVAKRRKPPTRGDFRDVAAIEHHSQVTESSRTTCNDTNCNDSATTQRQTRLSEQERKRLVELYQDGWTVKKLVTKYGIHKDTVSRHLETAGVPRRGWQRKMTDTQVKEASRLYAEDKWSLARLGKHFGVSASTISTELAQSRTMLRQR